MGVGHHAWRRISVKVCGSRSAIEDLPLLWWNHFDDTGSHAIFVNPFYELFEASKLFHGLQHYQLDISHANDGRSAEEYNVILTGLKTGTLPSS